MPARPRPSPAALIDFTNVRRDGDVSGAWDPVLLSFIVLSSVDSIVSDPGTALRTPTIMSGIGPDARGPQEPVGHAEIAEPVAGTLTSRGSGGARVD